MSISIRIVMPMNGSTPLSLHTLQPITLQHIEFLSTITQVVVLLQLVCCPYNTYHFENSILLTRDKKA